MTRPPPEDALSRAFTARGYRVIDCTPTPAKGSFPYFNHRTLAEVEATCTACGQERDNPCTYSGCPKREVA